MPWPTRSRRFIAYSSPTTAGTTVWLAVVPDGQTWLLKDVVVFNFGAGGQAIALWQEIDGVPFIWAHFAGLVAGGGAFQGGRSCVAHSGNRIGLSCASTATVSLILSGAQLGP